MSLNTMIAREQLGDNYMLGTIVRDGLRDILQRETSHAAEIVDRWANNGLDHLYLVGCGGSRAVLEPAKWLMDRFSRLPVDIYTAWEFFHRAPANLTERSATVLGSHSGTTEEVMLALELAKERGSMSLSFSRADTMLSENADDAMTYDSPATNLSKLLMNYLVATEMIERYGNKAAASELRQALQTLPDVFHVAKDANEEYGKSLAVKYQNAPGFYLIASVWPILPVCNLQPVGDAMEACSSLECGRISTRPVGDR